MPKPVSSTGDFRDLYPAQNRQGWTYQKHTNDFGCTFKHILIAKKENFVDKINFQFTPTNLEQIGKREQFSVSTAKTYYYIRDSRVLAPRGVLRSTDAGEKDSPVCHNAGLRSTNREIYLQTNSSSGATQHPSFKGTQGSGYMGNLFMRASDGYSQKSRKEFWDTFSSRACTTTKVDEEIRSTRSYWEGGNVYCCTNSSGEVKILIGEESLTFTHMILRQKQYFKSPNPQSGIYYDETKSTFAVMGGAFNRLFLRGKIPSKVEDLAPDLTDEEALKVGEEMAAMGLITQLDHSKIPLIKSMAKNYLGQRALITKVLWPEEFGVSAEHIHVIPQGDYHLDTFMRPGPNGSLFVQSYEENLKVLYRIKDLGEQYGLGQEDKEILEGYIQETLQLESDLKPVYEKIYAVCESAGFEIIRTPGAFFGSDSNNKHFNFNFLNGISGYSEANQRYYYIVGGITVGEKLGGLLMDAFTTFLEQSVAPFPIKAYYIGYDPDNPTDYSEVMKLAGGMMRAGIHCLTFELDPAAATVSSQDIQQ